MGVVSVVDRLHGQVRRSEVLFRVVRATRYLFAMAFVPTGFVKLMGERFTTISSQTPIGAFFEAMYQTGEYWQFLGAIQIVAGGLLLVPRTATLGAVVFFPVVLNICVITWALEFPGTVYVTTLMVVGAGGLLAWDWHRLRSIVVRTPAVTDHDGWVDALGPWWERAAWYGGLAAGLWIWFGIRRLTIMPIVPALVVGVVCVVVAFVGMWAGVRRRARTVDATEEPPPDR